MATFFSQVSEELTWLEGENGLAKLFLLREGDERNQILFTNRRLIVFRHGKLSIYDREQLSHVSQGQKKLLAPLLAGAIVGGFTLFAIFKGIAANSFAILILMACIYLFYIGLKGSYALMVHQISGRHMFSDLILTPNPGKGIDGFVGYVNQQLMVKEEQNLYLSITHHEWEHLLSQGMLSPTDRYFILSKRPEGQHSRIRLCILQDRLKNEIRYEENKDGNMEYRLYSPLERHQVRLYQEPVS